MACVCLRAHILHTTHTHLSTCLLCLLLTFSACSSPHPQPPSQSPAYNWTFSFSNVILCRAHSPHSCTPNYASGRISTADYHTVPPSFELYGIYKWDENVVGLCMRAPAFAYVCMYVSVDVWFSRYILHVNNEPARRARYLITQQQPL